VDRVVGMGTLKIMAAKVATNLLIVNTPLCTTNETQKIKISQFQQYTKLHVSEKFVCK
jgi:hypothetical protein